jgi:hypothetical protein
MSTVGDKYRSFRAFYQIDTYMPDYPTPEERLWLAVISQTIQDAAATIRNADRLSKTVGVVPTIFRVRIEETLLDVQDLWFQEMCAMVNFDSSYVVKKIEALKKQYRFEEVKFVITKKYLAMAMAIIEQKPEMAESLLAPIGRYIYYRRKLRREPAKTQAGN